MYRIKNGLSACFATSIQSVRTRAEQWEKIRTEFQNNLMPYITQVAIGKREKLVFSAMIMIHTTEQGLEIISM